MKSSKRMKKLSAVSYQLSAKVGLYLPRLRNSLHPGIQLFIDKQWFALQLFRPYYSRCGIRRVRKPEVQYVVQCFSDRNEGRVTSVIVERGLVPHSVADSENQKVIVEPWAILVCVFPNANEI